MRLIDADALKEWVENWFTKNRYYHPFAKNNNIPITELYDILEQMPSAQPERKRGKWIVYKAPDKQHCGLVKCPFCGEDMIAEADEYNFCPNCGAEMRGEQNE